MAMAKRSRNIQRRPAKLQPSPLTFTFATASSAPGVTLRSYIDLSQVASILARRFYRQGLNWAVAGFKISSLQAGTTVCSKVPNSWSASNGWHKTFALWNKQINETLEEGGNESLRARFSDFKVFADFAHVTAGVAGNLLPVDSAGNTAVPGEWDASHVVLPQTAPDGSGTLIDPSEFVLHMVGPNAGASKGIIAGYEHSRSFPQSPDPAQPPLNLVTNWMSAMFDVGSDNLEIMDNAEHENNDLPYPQQNYPGGTVQLPGLEWHDFAQIYSTSATTNVGITRMKGGNFPCGLIALDWTPTTIAANLVIQVDLIPGNHRGYLAEPMQDM